MTDERLKRPGTMSDADRALGRRRRTPPGVPVEIDPEVTPPPSEPPRPSTIAGYDTIAPPLQAQLDNLHAGHAQVVEALGKVWELRDGKWRDRIDINLAAIAKSVTIHETILGELRPQLDRWRAATDGLAQQLPKLIGALEGLTLHVRAIDDRLRHLELDVRALRERHDGHAEDLAARAASERSLVERVAALETDQKNREAVRAALAKKERRKSGLAGGGIGAIAGAIASAIVQAFK